MQWTGKDMAQRQEQIWNQLTDEEYIELLDAARDGQRLKDEIMETLGELLH